MRHHSLRTTPEALLQLVRDRWRIEGWHWIRDTQLHEDDHRYRGNGAGAMATLRTAALNLLRLAGLQSIRAGMQAVTHDITKLLAMALRQPRLKQDYYFESALPSVGLAWRSAAGAGPIESRTHSGWPGHVST